MRCPLCNSETSNEENTIKAHKYLNCPICGKYYINEEFLFNDKLINCAYNYLAVRNNNTTPFFSNSKESFQNAQNIQKCELINEDALLTFCPRNLNEHIDKILINISFYLKTIGNKISNIYLTNANDRQFAKKTGLLKVLFFICDNNIDEITILLKYMEKQGYIEPIGIGVFFLTLSFKGWLRIEEMQKENKNNNFCVVAMSSKIEYSEVKDEVQKLLHSIKLFPKFLDEKQDSLAAPEICFEIKRCRIFIADLTYHRPTVFYKAGYAEALNKPIIYTCRKDYLKRNYLETMQNIIQWKTSQELSKKLQSRIAAIL